MRTSLTLLSIGLGLAFGAATAHAQTQKITLQGDRAALCEKAAGDKKGDARKAFLSSCVVARSEPIKMTQTMKERGSQCEHGSGAQDL